MIRRRRAASSSSDAQGRNGAHQSPSAPAARGEAPEALRISLENYGFTYRAQAEPTLHDINLVIEPGERIALIGPSGSGKSTLLRAIAGLVPHRIPGTASGTIRVGDIDPAEVPLIETARRVGTVLQDVGAQFVGITVAEDIAFSLENQRVPQADMIERVRAAAALTDTDSLLGAAPLDLSGGQKQRVAISGVLVDAVGVLLFDEPLAMLDPASGRRAIELIDRIQSERDLTVILVEHRFEDVLHRGADRVVLMDEGRIVAIMTPDEIVATDLLDRHGIRPPLHARALALAGTPVSINQHPASVDSIDLTPEQRHAVCEWAAPTASKAPAARLKADDAGQHTTPAVELVGVTCTLRSASREVHAVKDVNLSIPTGQMVAILGSNGAGKTTLSRMICGFERPTEGSVLIDGEDIRGLSLAAIGQRAGFVLQEPSQMISQPTVSEEVALGLRARGISEAEAKPLVERALEICGLAGERLWPVSALSHGQRKRLTIASILVLDPSVLILDEPTSGQDLRHYTEFLSFVQKINRAGTTVLMITHDMHIALEYAERAIVLAQGRVIADDSPARVLADPSVLERADLTTTSLHVLAQRCGIEDPTALIERFISAEQGEAA